MVGSLLGRYSQICLLHPWLVGTSELKTSESPLLISAKIRALLGKHKLRSTQKLEGGESQSYAEFNE